MSALANSPVVSYREASQLIKNRAGWQTPLHDKELWLSESSVTKLDKAEEKLLAFSGQNAG
jgi:hypothetical protein